MKIIFIYIILLVLFILLTVYSLRCQNVSKFTDKQYNFAINNKKLFKLKNGYSEIKKSINIDPIDYFDLKKTLDV
jgi:cell division protein YceG involved in septum cleavage